MPNNFQKYYKNCQNSTSIFDRIAIDRQASCLLENIFLLKSEIKQSYQFLPLLYSIICELLGSTVEERKKKRGIQIRKIKLSFSGDHIIVYVKANQFCKTV